MNRTSRREFLKMTTIAGGGLVFGFSLTGCSDGQPDLPIVQTDGALVPNAFVQITPDNGVVFYCPRDEMGQGITTGLATILGEELDVDPTSVVIELAGAHADYTNPDFGVQATGGSTSIKAHYLPLRQVGANVRMLLLQAAAMDLNVPVEALKTFDRHVTNGSDRHPYGRFVATAVRLQAAARESDTTPADAPLKQASDFRYIGKDGIRNDALAKSTGTAVYGIDVDVPGMHHAVVRRPPVAGGTVASFDGAAALQMPGVTDVVAMVSGVAVVATRYWQAKKAAAVLEVKWTLPELANVDTARVRADYAEAMREDEGSVEGERGEVAEALANAKATVSSEYWAPYLAHAPMEPMNAVVRVENGEADVWSGTQGPVVAQGLVARYAGIDKEKVRVHSTYLGGGFGRRGMLSHIAEATQVAVVSGKPIKLLWSREDDIRNGVYRPASLMRINAGIDADNIISAWQAKRVGGNVMPGALSAMLPGIAPAAVPDGMVDWLAGTSASIFDGWMVDHSSIEGLYEDYDFPNREVRHVTRDHGVPLLFWRSVGHSFTAFAKESAVDELAAQVNADVVDLRLQNTADNPRLNNVIRIAGEQMRAVKPGEGRVLGIAAHASFGSYVAEVAEVSVTGGKIKVHKIFCVVDCGQVVNPDIVRSQMEGAIMYGLTAALHGNLELKDGAIQESNFHDYPILRMNEAPAVEVTIVPSELPPSGVGEPGLPPVAPAVANAVYLATGQRLRSLPLRLA